MGLFLIFVGLMLTFGAVGGMDSVPVYEPNPNYRLQVLLAFAGLAISGLGAAFASEGDAK